MNHYSRSNSLFTHTYTLDPFTLNNAIKENYVYDNIDVPNGVLSSQNNEFELKVGMVAYSEEEAFNMYNKYAYYKSLSIRRDQKSFKRNSGELIRRSFVCSKEGFREFIDPTQVKKVERLETRCGCRARVVFKVENGVYTISQLITEHNHPFVEPNQRHLIRSSRTMHNTSKGVIKSMSEAGIRATKTYAYLLNEAGGYQNVGFTERDCQNFIQVEQSKKIEAGDGQSLINYFKHKQVIKQMFFYTVQVDEENRMTNFFWRDGLSKLDYECFGDVVVFDTTYRTSKYNMICVPFVGVNHHWKNVLFGCAFLCDETTASFVWLFETFLEAMDYKAPKTIFTDQDHAMANAIARVLPNTQHCLCH